LPFDYFRRIPNKTQARKQKATMENDVLGSGVAVAACCVQAV
jgi:hypothetical protein